MDKMRAWLFALVLLLPIACTKPAEQYFQGYVEGEYVFLSAPLSGYLATLDVARGGKVAAKASAFSIADELEQQALNQAEAQVRAASARWNNLSDPRRPEEIATREAQLRSADAALKLSTAQLKQQQELSAKGFVSELNLDQAKAAQARNAAAVEEARQQLAMSKERLGRQAEIRSAEQEVKAAQALLAQKQWQVDKKKVAVPASGVINETYYRAGEWVSAGQPVVSVLPDDKRRIRFFVPETQLANLRIGQTVVATCDGCSGPLPGNINFIANQAEYTPPVIYSQGSREKLVFRVEAAISSQDGPRAHPGMPVEVRLK
ncbi:MAG: HlyD family efflux transporter periplasmic adaptor subunit [Gallionella sp.]